MSLLSNGLLDAIKGANATESKSVKLATVTAVTSAGVKLKFYGEDTASKLTYKRLDSYSPVVGDTVMVNNINNSWLVSGKVV